MEGMFQTITKNNIVLFQNFAKTTILLEKWMRTWQISLESFDIRSLTSYFYDFYTSGLLPHLSWFLNT
jgi:hypothetical protein